MFRQLTDLESVDDVPRLQLLLLYLQDAVHFRRELVGPVAVFVGFRNRDQGREADLVFELE